MSEDELQDGVPVPVIDQDWHDAPGRTLSIDFKDADDRARILAGDCLERMAELPDHSIDAVVTDPPYGIRFMGQAWDGADIEREAEGIRQSQLKRRELGTAARNDNFAGAPSAAGAYDLTPRGMLAFQQWTQAWATEAYRLLKPGGYLLSFSSARTYHRMTAGIEDAGFEIRDQLLWIFGSGFPKSLDVSKAIDKAAGAEREVVGQGTSGRSRSVLNAALHPESFGGDYDVTAPATDDAHRWAGWGTALKPAHEPVVMARKPLIGTVMENVLEHGTGAINVDATRIGKNGGTRQTQPKAKPDDDAVTSFGRSIGSAPGGNEEAGGRWPANVLLAHLPDCKGTTAAHTDKLCAPGCPVAELNEAGELTEGNGPTPADKRPTNADVQVTNWSKGGRERSGAHYGDSGGAARFFYIAKAKRRERVAGVERNLHPTVKPVELMRHLIRLVTPPGGVVLDPFLGSGTTGCAAAAERVRFLGVERDEQYLEVARARIADWLFAHPVDDDG